MKFWDSSAIVPLLVSDACTAAMETLLRQDPAQVIWWGTPVECASAIARLEREGSMELNSARAAFERLRRALAGWVQVPANVDVRDQAIRILRVHPLRAADALQLGAAVVASDFQTGTLDFVTLDVGLEHAAEREGFRVLTGDA